MPGRVLLVRHGHTKLNKGGETSVDRIRGWSNVPLDELGLQEADRIAQDLAKEPISIVVASDLIRSVQTGRAIARRQGVRLTATRELRPWALGKLTGKPSSEAQRLIERYARDTPETRVPAGEGDGRHAESFEEFRDRVLSAFRQILGQVKKSGRTVAVVSHFRDVKLIEAWIDKTRGSDTNDVELKTFFRNDISPGAVLEITPRGEGWKYQVLSRGVSEAPAAAGGKG